MNGKCPLRFEEVEQHDILQLTKIVKVSVDALDVDPDDVDESMLLLKPGLYATDSVGELWMKMEELTGLFAMFGVNDPFLRDERGKARQRQREAKRAKRRRSAA